MKGYLGIAGCAFLSVVGWLSAACAEEEPPLSDLEVRKAAREILADPAFQGFEHFAEPGPASKSGAASPADSSSSSPPPDQNSGSTAPADSGAPEKQGLPRTTPSSKTSRDGSPSTKSEPTAPGSTKPEDSRPESTPASPAESNASQPASSAPDSDPSDPTEAARPERAAAGSLGRTAPSLRGRDGVERPVRYAPKPVKVPEPEPPSSSWTLDPMFGDFFAAIGQALGGVMHGLAYVALVVIAVLILVLVARALTDWWQPGRRRAAARLASTTELEDEHSPGEVPADRYLQQALELARQQQYRQALGQLVLGAMSTIEREHWIRYRRGLTLNDYLRAVRSYPTTFAGFRELLAAYEPVEYGRREANAALFEAALGGYRSGFSISS